MAVFRSHTQAVHAQLAHSNVADHALPARLTNAQVGLKALSVHAGWPADGDRAINASPSFITLAALTIVLIVVDEALMEVVFTADHHGRDSLQFGRIEYVLSNLVVTVCRVQHVALCIQTTRSQRARILRYATPGEVQLLVVLVVDDVKERIESTVQVDTLQVAH